MVKLKFATYMYTLGKDKSSGQLENWRKPDRCTIECRLWVLQAQVSALLLTAWLVLTPLACLARPCAGPDAKWANKPLYELLWTLPDLRPLSL